MLKPIAFAVSAAVAAAIAPPARADDGAARQETMDWRHDHRDIREENLDVPQGAHEPRDGARERNIERRDPRHDRRKGAVKTVKADRDDLAAARAGGRTAR